MPETRYKEVYEQGTGKLLRREPYVVSDEELEIERLMMVRDKILAKPKKDWTIEDIKNLLEILVQQTR